MTKVLGQIDLIFSFLKSFWETLKPDFLAFLAEFHANGRLVKGSNSSFICLIPKKDNPQQVGDLRPISLIGCMYKVLAKLLANRLRGVMPRVISDIQLAYVIGRQYWMGFLWKMSWWMRSETKKRPLYYLKWILKRSII